MNVAELTTRMVRAKADIDQALAEWHQRISEDAIADDDCRRAMARAYLTSKEQLGGKATVPQINAAVDLETAELQKKARMAEGLKRSAAAAFDSKKQWLSALQSLASLSKAEAQLAAWEPRETASA